MPNPAITSIETVAAFLRELASASFCGNITIKMQHGEAVHVIQESSLPVEKLQHRTDRGRGGYVDLSRFLRQPVKTQFSLNGELCHGSFSTNFQS